jgi:nitroreductase
MQVTDAVKKRASVRAYLDTPISEAEIRDWLTQAQRAPSGGNLQTLALLATARGWGTCMQECWGILRPSLKAHFGLAPHEMVYCGMALGHPDPDAAVNALYTERAELEEFAELRGF